MTIDKSQITAIILAGGQGRRLGGQDKGLVEYQGKPLIQHVLDKITPQVDSVMINANRNQESYSTFGYDIVTDKLSDFQGPLAGFAIAMQESKTKFILTMPCDDHVNRMEHSAKKKIDRGHQCHYGSLIQPW